jgi:TP901 family phage tail tape measure protein
MNDTIKMVLKLIDEATAPLRGVRDEVDALGGTSKRVAEGGLAVLKGAMAAAVTVATTLTATLGAVGGAALKLGGDFEAEMNVVSVSVSGAQENMAALEQTALSLGSSTAFSAMEAAEAITMLGKNGLDAQTILDGALESSLNLAAATGTDLATASDVATDAMLQFNLTASDLPGVVDLIAGSTNASKFGIEDFSGAMAAAGGVAGSVGVDFNEFATAIAGISPSFNSGQDAGTAFKTFLVSLPGNTKQAKDAMAELNLEFFDSGGNMKSMSDIAGQLEGAFAGLTEEQKLTYAQTIFGTDAMRAALSMAELGAAGFDTLAASVASVDSEEQAAARMLGFKGAVEQLQGAWETLLIKLFNSGLGEWATEGVTALGDFLSALSENEAFLNGFLGTVQTVFGTLGTLLREAVTIGQEVFTTLSGFYSENEGTVNAWLGNVQGYWTGFQTAVGEVINFAVGLWQEVLKPAWSEIEPFVSGFLTTVQANFGQTKENLASVFDFLVALWSQVLYPAWNAIAPFVQGVWDAVLTAITTVWSLIEPVFNAITALLKGDFSAAWESAKEAARIAWEGLRDIILSIGEGLVESLNQIGADIVQGLLNGITGMMDNAKATVTDFGNDVIGWFNGIFERQSPAKVFVRMAIDIVRGLIVGLQDNAVLGELYQKATKVGDVVNSAIKGSLSTIDLTELFPGISGINFGGGSGGSGGTPEAEAPKEIDLVKKGFLDLGEKVLPGLGNAITAFQAGPIAGIIAVFTTLLSRSEVFGQLIEQVSLILEPVIDAVGGLLTALWPAIQAILKMVEVGLKPLTWVLTNIVAPVFTVVAKIVAGIWNAFASAVNWALGWLGIRLEKIDLSGAVDDPTKDIPTPEPPPTTDIPRPEPNPTREVSQQAEIQFGSIPQAVQFAIATPLIDAVNQLTMVATMMKESLGGTGSISLSASAAIYDSASTRFDRAVSRFEATNNRLITEGITIRSETTVNTGRANISRTASLR